MDSLTLHFPFSIENNESSKSKIETTIERKNSIISFSIPFSIPLNLSIPKAINKTNDKIYVFEFQELDDCLSWMDSKEVFVEQRRKDDVFTIQKEMDEFMMNYEEKERKKKKRKIVDEDGFTYYE